MSQNLKLPLDKFVIGQYVWWSASRHFGAEWSVPGVIVAVDIDNNTFTLKTFDDTEEATLSIYTTGEKSEFRSSNIEEVKRFLYAKISKFKMDLTELDDKKYQVTADLNKFTEILENL